MSLDDAERLDLHNRSVSGAYRKGNGTPLLLIHGNSSCKEAFSQLWRLVARIDCEALAIDLPGHGASLDATDPDTTYTFPGYSRLISSIIDETGWRRVIAVGWSLGGHIALQAKVDDRRITGAFVIGTPPGQPSIEAFEAAFNADPVTRLAGAEAFSDDDALRYTRAMLGVDDPDQVLVTAAKRTDGRARSRLIQSVAEGLGADQRQAYADGAHKVAVIVGNNDPFIRMTYLDTLETDGLWENKVHRLPNSGHAPHYLPSDDFIRLFSRFLDASKSDP